MNNDTKAIDEISDFKSMVYKFNQFRAIDIGKSEELSEVKVDENENAPNKNVGKEVLERLQTIKKEINENLEKHNKSIENIQEKIKKKINERTTAPTKTRSMKTGGAAGFVGNDKQVKQYIVMTDFFKPDDNKIIENFKKEYET